MKKTSTKIDASTELVSPWRPPSNRPAVAQSKDAPLPTTKAPRAGLAARVIS
jgi:hypothetical protein